MKFSKKNIFLILMFGLIAILVFMSTRETKKYVKDGKKEKSHTYGTVPRNDLNKFLFELVV